MPCQSKIVVTLIRMQKFMRIQFHRVQHAALGLEDLRLRCPLLTFKPTSLIASGDAHVFEGATRSHSATFDRLVRPDSPRAQCLESASWGGGSSKEGRE